MSNKSSFLLLNNSIQEKLAALNITNPTAVQNEIIPQILEGKDILFQSETGTGKTFAYLLPLINKIEENDDIQSPKIIVIAPTIELASQINSACKTVSSRKSALLVGGAPLKRQIEILKEKPQIIIGTAARLNELIRLKKLKVDKIVAIVFDETDRLVKKELYDDTAELKNLMPQNCQIIACSATLNNPTKKFFYGIDSVTLEPENILKDRITHWAIYAETRDKIDTLRKFLLAEKPTKALIFTSRADQVENIYNKLTYKKIECVCLHAKTDKQKRKSAIDRFKSGKEKILVTSDLAARGLDIQEVSHIIQMDLPNDEDFFVHRCGRTARAGKKGINVVIGDEYEMNHYAQLEKKLGLCVYPKEIYNGKVSEIKM
ncbi:MAG: DEAD/DEAH box helicase [Spirochaetaceae bacterium]|nr:DEAD/DEAH box helicase [Spirochaetaceae bacterium]